MFPLYLKLTLERAISFLILPFVLLTFSGNADLPNKDPQRLNQENFIAESPYGWAISQKGQVLRNTKLR